jgi:hypothetical protein
MAVSLTDEEGSKYETAITTRHALSSPPSPIMFSNKFSPEPANVRNAEKGLQIYIEGIKNLMEKQENIIGLRLRVHEARSLLRHDREALMNRDAQLIQRLRAALASNALAEQALLVDGFEDLQRSRDSLQPIEDDYNRLEDQLNREEWKLKEMAEGGSIYDAACLEGLEHAGYWDRIPTASSLMRRAKRYLPMIINGSKFRTVPDTGSLENAISADEVRRLRLNFTGNIRQFVMGNGSTTISLGSVSLKCAFAQGDSHTTFQQFNVIENLAVPVIMGKRFLDNSKTLTSNQHRLEVIYTTVKRTFRLLHLDRPRQLMRCYVNGSLVHANADTGAEMDLMSPSFALSNSLNIETLDEWERRVELADGRTAELLGKVRVGFDAYDACSSSPTKSKRHVRTFYLMEGLTSDVLLGEDALYDINAFTEHSDSFFESSDCGECPELNLITWLEGRERQLSDALGVLSSASTKESKFSPSFL